MTFAPVGIRCPEHANVGAGQASRRSGRCRTSARRRRPLAAPATMVLIAINVVVYVITAAQGGGINLPGGELFSKLGSAGRAPSRTATGGGSSPRCSCTAASSTSRFNMLALYWLGTIIEQALGTPRFLLVYFVSGLAGIGGRALVQLAVRRHRGRLRRDLRPDRRAPHPRVPRDRVADGAGDGADPRQPRVHVRRPGHLDRRPPRRARRRHRRHLRADALPDAAAAHARDRDRGRRRRRQRRARVRARARLRRPERHALGADRPHDERDAVDPHDVDGRALSDRAARPRSGRSSARSRPEPGRAGPGPARSGSRRPRACPTTVGAFEGPAASGSSAAAAACA